MLFGLRETAFRFVYFSSLLKHKSKNRSTYDEVVDYNTFIPNEPLKDNTVRFAFVCIAAN